MSAYGDTSPRDIPIYIGATGDKILELAGEIANGLLLNYVLSVDYIRRAIERVEEDAKRAGRTLQEVDRPELIVCSLSDEDPAAAMAEAKKLVAYYLAREPHIMNACKVNEDLLEEVQSIMSWPATEEDYQRASQVIPDEVVRDLIAVGTSNECRSKVKEYVDAGVTCPVLYPLMDDIGAVVDTFAEGL
ncbi:MAG: LLM class flavin-dependent oxidoreductase [Anaerolineales bacterium]